MVHAITAGSSLGQPLLRLDPCRRLTNGAMLPVVLSIDCSSAAFQDSDGPGPRRRWSTPWRRRRGLRRHQGLAVLARHPARVGDPRRPPAAGPRGRGASREAAGGRRADQREDATRGIAPSGRARRRRGKTRAELSSGTSSAIPRCRCRAASRPSPGRRAIRAFREEFDFPPPRPDPPLRGPRQPAPEFNGEVPA